MSSTNYRATAFATYPPHCDKCGHSGDSDNRIEVHHRDTDRTNHDASNLRILCGSCHKGVHVAMRQQAGTNGGTAMIVARVDPVLLQRVSDEATRRYDGNDSMLVRKAVIDFLDLSDALGSAYEMVVDGLKRQGAEKAEVAA